MENSKNNEKIENVFDETFSGVIGYESIKFELKRIVDIMRNPQKYFELGVKTPAGILFEGDPGLGKTFMANCFIKASGRKYFICRKDKPDGDFVNEIRKIYEKAKENAPSIVFLDDMDKFANEDDDHINAEEFVAIQSCIDDTKNFEVFTIATVNSIKKIPESLLRSGRFDKRFWVDAPEGEDAEKIIEYYLSKKKYVGKIDIKQLAAITVGKSCADIETIINEAGIYAGFEGRKQIDNNDVIRAVMRVIFKAPEVLGDKDRRHIKQIAYHEAGHAVVLEVLEPGGVNILSVKKYEGDIAGITAFFQNDDYLYEMKYMENRLISLLGGRAATELVFGEVDTGASNDLGRAFSLASRFVENYCVFGFDNAIQLEGHQNSGDYHLKKERLISNEVERCYQIAKKILIDNREFLDKLANELIEKETILQDDVKRIRETCKIVNYRQ